ncbi:CPBP family intramembrane glutamic endopeptidase [Candidatus Poriferisodalis sp.]|uniref:CPBP family intramembrane glutamic endopeptidase n=1 Tax=Candidatus Poriferisodalis sp. TaxID=3101277 RepID=UPI003B527E60
MALWAWYERRPEQLAEVVEYVRDWPIWAFVSAGILTAVVAAVLEETVYRGVVQDSLERVLGSDFVPLVMQAAIFAALHFPSGILQGLTGVVLVFPYGLLLGVLRRRSGGLAVPIIAHFSTDLVIVGIVLSRIVA